jgi:hypothetical protein
VLFELNDVGRVVVGATPPAIVVTTTGFSDVVVELLDEELLELLDEELLDDELLDDELLELLDDVVVGNAFMYKTVTGVALML